MERIQERQQIRQLSISALVEDIQQSIEMLRKQNVFSQGLNRMEAERLQAKKERLFLALEDCIYGSLPDKEYVKEYIREHMVGVWNIHMGNIDAFVPFDREPHLTVQDRFEIILHALWKKHGTGALSCMIRSFGLDRMREENGMEGFHIDASDIRNVYASMKITLDFEDRMQFLVQRVYAEYKGYRMIDMLLDMAVDGISLGVSGLTEDFSMTGTTDFSGNQSVSLQVERKGKSPKAYDSVWIFHAGKSIHLRFLSLGSFAELKRVCSTIFKYGHPGEISKSVGYRVNRLKDGSRCVVVRPDFAESWACFIRKFDLPDVKLESLIIGDRSELVIDLLKYIIKGARNTSVTGSQGSGKTTLMKSLIEHIHGTYPLRVLEMAFELHIRKTQPNRNILTVRETEDVSGQRGMDLLKKTDGAVTIVGEVASDPVAAYMIQTAQTASLFTLFSHHAKTFPDLVMELRNSLLKQNVFTQERVAEEQVVRVLDVDVHLERDIEGNRYISRITECLPEDTELMEDKPIRSASSDPTAQKEDCFGESVMTAEESDRNLQRARLMFYRSGAGMRTYRYRNLIEYDLRNRRYVAVHAPSQGLIREMSRSMTTRDCEAFESYLGREFASCPSG